MGGIFFQKIFGKYLKSCIFALTKKKEVLLRINDPVVQLVRMPPCHGGGRGFESRPDRNPVEISAGFFYAFIFHFFHFLNGDWYYNCD